MKVYIGPYLTWWGPYQIAGLLQHIGVDEDTCYRYGERLAAIPGLRRLCEWVHDHRRRTVRVRVDSYDTWSVDTTLIPIILQLLKRYSSHLHGSRVDDVDVPVHIRRSSAPPVENDWDADIYYHDRWEWVVGEMVWAFQRLWDEDNDIQLMPPDEEDRVANGLKLFGKYFRSLWD